MQDLPDAFLQSFLTHDCSVQGQNGIVE
jgi:hypothetical protein